MSNLSETLKATAVDSSKAIEIDRLADLVEAQIDNILGGGYSQYSAYHGKDANQLPE
jgi:hypothetical protein